MENGKNHENPGFQPNQENSEDDYLKPGIEPDESLYYAKPDSQTLNIIHEIIGVHREHETPEELLHSVDDLKVNDANENVRMIYGKYHGIWLAVNRDERGGGVKYNLSIGHKVEGRRTEKDFSHASGDEARQIYEMFDALIKARDEAKGTSES
jgi:hypothetical protein